MDINQPSFFCVFGLLCFVLTTSSIEYIKCARFVFRRNSCTHCAYFHACLRRPFSTGCVEVLTGFLQADQSSYRVSITVLENMANAEQAAAVIIDHSLQTVLSRSVRTPYWRYRVVLNRDFFDQTILSLHCYHPDCILVFSVSETSSRTPPQRSALSCIVSIATGNFSIQFVIVLHVSFLTYILCSLHRATEDVVALRAILLLFGNMRYCVSFLGFHYTQTTAGPVM